MLPDRRKKDWLLYALGTITLSIILFVGGWIGRNATHVLDTYPALLEKIESINDEIKDIQLCVDENKKLMQDLRKNQEIIKLRQTKVIDTLRNLLDMHKLPDRLPLESHSIEEANKL